VDPAQVRADLAHLDVGQRLGNYVLAEKLGEGGFGEVYRALLPVAIKIARTADDVDRLQRFATLQKSVGTERIVQPLELVLDADPPYVVMELVEGATLRDLFARGPMASSSALPLLIEVARGLADAHRAGVAHLDLKPENVLVDRAGAVKLTDFDLAVPTEGLDLSLNFTQHGPAGTLAYMSPEQRAGSVSDARSDVYTFGVCLFEALTGTLPQPGDVPSDFVEDLAPGIDELFQRCFARQERRFVDASELVAALEPLLAALPERDRVADLVATLPPPLPLSPEQAPVEAASPPERTEVPNEEVPNQEVPNQEVPNQDLSESPPEPEPQALDPLAARRPLDDLIAERAARAREESLLEATQEQSPEAMPEG
jgi:serine/threonine protein kinase